MTELRDGLATIVAAGTVTSGIYRILMGYGRWNVELARRWWTKRQVAGMEALAQIVTAYFGLGIAFILLGEKMTGMSLILGFGFTAQIFITTITVWPSMSTTARKLLKLKR